MKTIITIITLGTLSISCINSKEANTKSISDSFETSYSCENGSVRASVESLGGAEAEMHIAKSQMGMKNALYTKSGLRDTFSNEEVGYVQIDHSPSLSTSEIKYFLNGGEGLMKNCSAQDEDGITRYNCEAGEATVYIDSNSEVSIVGPISFAGKHLVYRKSGLRDTFSNPNFKLLIDGDINTDSVEISLNDGQEYLKHCKAQ